MPELVPYGIRLLAKQYSENISRNLSSQPGAVGDEEVVFSQRNDEQAGPVDVIRTQQNSSLISN